MFLLREFYYSLWHVSNAEKTNTTMNNILSIILLSATGSILLYTWFLFPACMLLMRHKHLGKREIARPVSAHKPHVSILISAWNEADVIKQRITNIAALEYPRESIAVFVGTDGCTDHTPDIVEACQKVMPLNITLCKHAHNRGKASVLIDLVSRAVQQQPSEGTILVFTDANTFFKADAITILTQRLDDPDVGGVCGRLIFQQNSEQHHEQPEQTYWSWETKLKEMESYYDSCLGANGAIYAIRPTCFWYALPTQAIIDDFVIGMKVRETGLRMIFEPNAIAYEDLPAPRDEWNRRVRIGTGAFQALCWCRSCLHPRYGRFALFFWSHKVLRWFTPHLIILFLISALLTLLAAGQAPLALMATIAAAISIGLIPLLTYFIPVHSKARYNKYLAAWQHFITMQAALFTGCIRFFRGNVAGHWKRTPRNITRDHAA